MNKTLSKIIKAFLSVILIPVTIVFIVAFIRFFSSVKWNVFPAALFCVGAGCYIIVYAAYRGESFTYVLGHELMHAMTTFLFGGKLVSLFVSHKSGSVKTTKDNMIISLAPYSVSFYALVLAVLYFCLSVVTFTWSMRSIFIFCLGVAMMQHVLMSIRSILIGQSDIRAHGTLFSLHIIFVANIVSAVFFLSFFIQAVPAVRFYKELNSMLLFLWTRLV